MGHRDPGPRHSRDPRSDARHNFEIHALRSEHLGLFSAAPKDVGIAALETHHALTRSSHPNQKVVDLFLRYRVVARHLPHRVELDLRRQLGWESRSSEAIEDHDVSLEETLPSAHGEQPWASRAGANQADQTRAVVMRNPPSSHSLRCAMFHRRLEPGALLDRGWHPRGEVFGVDSVAGGGR
jgi:hypothetical protein